MQPTESLAGRLEHHLAKQSVLRKCYPLVRLFVLVVLSLSWYAVTPLGLACFAFVFLTLCALAPHNPWRLKTFLLAAAVALIAWVLNVLKGQGSTIATTTQALLLLARVLLLISTALMFVTVLDTRSILDIFRRIPGVRRFAPSVVAFLRMFPHSMWVFQRTREAWQSRGYVPSFGAPRTTAVVLRTVAAPRILSVLAFLSDYSDVLYLRAGDNLRGRAYEEDYRAPPSWTVFTIGVLLIYVLLMDKGVL